MVPRILGITSTPLIVRPRYGITTNGTLLTPKRLEWLAERDFLIGISVDGSPAMHNTNRCYADGSEATPQWLGQLRS